ncbi:uncharacterized protein TNCV_656321 [Trichonephila clavipes]|nr:uncharacterized protein TNCV_656321 [Trichonephila clavipes]
MDVCKCLVPSRHGGTLSSRQAASPLMRLLEVEERWEGSDHSQSVLPLNWGLTEPHRTFTCMVLKAMANDRRHLSLCHDEFRRPRSGLCRSDSISSKNNKRKIVKSKHCIIRRITCTLSTKNKNKICGSAFYSRF